MCRRQAFLLPSRCSTVEMLDPLHIGEHFVTLVIMEKEQGMMPSKEKSNILLLPSRSIKTSFGQGN